MRNREGELILLAFAHGYWEEGNQPLFLGIRVLMMSDEEVQ
jgi:hypothetical protein